MPRYIGVLSRIELIRLLDGLREVEELSSAIVIETSSLENKMHEVTLTCDNHVLCDSFKNGLLCRWGWNERFKKKD